MQLKDLETLVCLLHWSDVEVGAAVVFLFNAETPKGIEDVTRLRSVQQGIHSIDGGRWVRRICALASSRKTATFEYSRCSLHNQEKTAHRASDATNPVQPGLRPGRLNGRFSQASRARAGLTQGPDRPGLKKSDSERPEFPTNFCKNCSDGACNGLFRLTYR